MTPTCEIIQIYFWKKSCFFDVLPSACVIHFDYGVLENLNTGGIHDIVANIDIVLARDTIIIFFVKTTKSWSINKKRQMYNWYGINWYIRK